MALITKGAFKALLLAQGKLPRVLPRQQHPDLIAAAYTKKIQAIMRRVHALTKERLTPLLKQATEEASRIATTDAEEEQTKVTHKEIPGKVRKGRLGQELRARAILWEWPDGVGFRVSTEWYEVANGLTYGHPARGQIFEGTQRAEAEAAFEKLQGKIAVEEAAPVEAGALDAIGVELDALRAQVAALFTREKLAGIVDPFASATEKFQAEQLNRQLREAVAVDVVGSEPWLAKASVEFTRENVALIRTIPSRYFDEIETLVRREAADGARWETLVDGIEERYDVSRSRSKIIARDQVGKFYGDLNRVRQTDLGITRFIWRTVRDNRVRPEHADIDGHTFTWGSAPDGGPGEAVLCRCYAEPDLSTVLNESSDASA